MEKSIEDIPRKTLDLQIVHVKEGVVVMDKADGMVIKNVLLGKDGISIREHYEGRIRITNLSLATASQESMYNED